MDLLAQNNDQLKIQFTARLNRRFNVRELKAVAVKYAGVPAYGTKAIFIESIWEYCSVNIHLLTENEWIEINHSPTNANANANEDQPILWIIDRTPTPWIQSGLLDRIRLYDQANYEPAADEFIPFTPTNLFNLFEAETKKFDIVPLILCTETAEELEIVSDCAICYEATKLQDSVILNCEHQFCHGCVTQTLAKCRPICALCREPMSVFIVKNQTIYDSVSELCKLD